MNFSTPAFPVVANVTAKAETDPIRIKNLLVDQITSPVLWVDTREELTGLMFAACRKWTR